MPIQATHCSLVSAEATTIFVGLAGRQHRVVASRQLIAAGVSRSLIASRVANGWLVPIFRGVYALGLGALDVRGRWTAATLAAGGSAVLSHRSAAALHGLVSPGSGPLEVSRPGGGLSRLVSHRYQEAPPFTVRVHRSRGIGGRDVTRVDGIGVTSVPRTFMDLAESSTVDQLASALSQAERMRSVSRDDLLEAVRRGGRRRGAGRLRDALDSWSPLEAETRSELEAAFLRLCRKHGIPMPAVNTAVGAFEVDFLWLDARLVIEVDGFEYHSGKRSFKADRDRDIDLELAGYTVARLTHTAILDDEALTAGRVKGLLTRAEARTGSDPRL